VLNLISIQKYATKYKLSTFATIKLINQGKLKTIKKMIDGEEKELIVDESSPHIIASASKNEDPQPNNYEHAYHELLAKYSALQEKYTTLMEEKNRAPK